ncbi:hypothetical protein DPMN_023266 [Dreissena polymorpha]|uniref:Uncharacterized protein n=1 Tax=Dreissena polymorpha TaxID=45954 RepID=A0A9D4RAK3_DREPO|nr:hypothetical protein DPMN_023266 [Dreissena polymorpha]
MCSFMNTQAYETDQQTDQQTGQKQYVPHYYIYLRVPGVNVSKTNGKDEKNNTAVIITEIGSSPNIGNLSAHPIFHHGDWTINATESVNMFLPKSCKEKAPPLGGHVFHDIIGTLYRVLKRSDCPPLQNIVGATERPSALSNLARDCPDTRKNAPPPGAHVFEPTGNHF